MCMPYCKATDERDPCICINQTHCILVPFPCTSAQGRSTLYQVLGADRFQIQPVLFFDGYASVRLTLLLPTEM
jgi:hypothetical protein